MRAYQIGSYRERGKDRKCGMKCMENMCTHVCVRERERGVGVRVG